jgi:hypothetical protein
MDSTLISAVLYAFFFGGIFSVILGVHSKRTATDLIHPLFGMNTATLLNYVIVFIITFSFVIGTTFAMLIQDVKYVKEHPSSFTMETLTMGLFPALMIFILMFFRHQPITLGSYSQYLLLSMKFGLAHLLFQFSGIYTSVFGL